MGEIKESGVTPRFSASSNWRNGVTTTEMRKMRGGVCGGWAEGNIRIQCGT